MNQNDVRKAIDTRLSGLSLSPRMQAEIRSRAHGNAQPHMRRKLSMSLAFALLALLLAATAGAAAYFGVTRFHAEQENNAVYQAHVLAVGEQIQSRHADITLNDAVFDGSSLSFALDISHRSGTCIRASPRFRTGNKSAPPSSASSASPKINPSAHFPRCTAARSMTAFC